MSETDAGKKAERLERPRRIGGGTAEGTGRARQTDTARGEQTGDGALVSMEAVVRRENVTAVYQRVVRNGGAPGVDGVTVDELAYCQTHWDRIRQELLEGRRPLPAPTDTEGRDSETGGRPAAARYPDGDGPDDSTGGAADPATILRPDVFERQLWLSSETQRAQEPSWPGMIGWWIWIWSVSSTG